MPTVYDALVAFIRHYNAAVSTQPKPGETASAEYTAQSRAALNLAVAILQSVGFLPTGGCGECEACRANAADAVEDFLASMFDHYDGKGTPS